MPRISRSCRATSGRPSDFHAASLELHRQLGDRQSVAYAANNLANTAVQLGDYAQARELYEETIDVTRDLGDVRGMVFGSINLADVVAREGDLVTARTLHEQSLATIRDLGDRWTEAFALDAFGRATGRAGDRERAPARCTPRPWAWSRSCATGAASPGSSPTWATWR